MTKEGVFQQWAEKAEGDLRSAKVLLSSREPGVYDAACFHVQQCAEKYIKALLSYRAIFFEKTHDLRELVGLLPAAEQGGFAIADLVTLSALAVNQRYPGLSPMSTEGDAKEGLAAAERIKSAVLALRKSAGDPGSPQP